MVKDKTLEELQKLETQMNKGLDECPVCGTPTVEKETDFTTVWVYQCDCPEEIQTLIEQKKKQRRLDQKTDRLIDEAGVPKAYRDLSINEFDPQDSQNNALQLCERYISRWGYVSENGLGIIFSGGVGVGKTHLAVSILRELILKHQIDGRFVTIERWLSRVKGAMDYWEQTQEEFIRPLEACDLAVLDELAVEYLTAWEEKTLRRVIDYRVKNDRPIITTTNNSVEEIKTSLGPRLFSRLRGKTGAIELKGKDMRTEKKVDLEEALAGS